jgi:hypothetical protein
MIKVSWQLRTKTVINLSYFFKNSKAGDYEGDSSCVKGKFINLNR